jgi:thiol-disulfide isomerase/thioredoxin
MSATFLFRRAVLMSVLMAAISMIATDSVIETAPRFRAKTLGGENFTNDAVKGKVVLLQFWTTWCQYCRSEQELVDDIDAEFRDKGLVVLAVNVGESKKTVKKYLERAESQEMPDRAYRRHEPCCEV